VLFAVDGLRPVLVAVNGEQSQCADRHERADPNGHTDPHGHNVSHEDARLAYSVCGKPLFDERGDAQRNTGFSGGSV